MVNSIHPLTVLCDIDNTILNTEQLIVDEYNRRYNKSITLNDVTCWNYFSDKVDDGFFEFLTKPKTWDGVQPIEAICRLVRTIVAQPDYFAVYLVTATNPLKTGLREKLTVASKATGVDKHHIITCNDKHLLMGDIMIDDYTKNIDDTLCNDCWLVDRPWNKEYTTSDNYSTTADKLSNNFKDCWFASVYTKEALHERELKLPKEVWRLIP